MLTQGNVRDRASVRPEGLGRWLGRPGNVALIAASAAWAAAIVLILRHTIFVTNDSLNNYAHVWYVSDRLWHGHGVPLRMPVLEHGGAYTFPYGFIPWVSAAIVRPLLGDWTVTLWLVLGFLGVVATQWWAVPELRGGWWTALLLVEPILVEAVILGQLSFLWAAAMIFAAIALWRSERWLLASVLLGLGQATHAAVMLPIVGALVLARLYWEPDRWRLLRCYALSLLIAAPAAWIVLASPAVGETTRAELVSNFFETATLRAVVVAAPFIGLAVLRTPLARAPAAIMVLLIGLNVAIIPPRHNEFAWGALMRSPDTSFGEFVDSANFVPRATYRLLRVADGKVAMYQVVKGGGRLDSEFFPESIERKNWPSTQEYEAFLRKRNVDYVVIFASYDERYRTNEHQLLEALAGQSSSVPDRGGICVQRSLHAVGYDVYRVSRCDAVRASPTVTIRAPANS